MDYSKLYRPSSLNSFQFIALTGLLMSAGAHLILRLFVRPALPTGFGWLYVCWLGFYAVGTVINLFAKPAEPDHHDHNHDHSHEAADEDEEHYE